MNWIVQVQIGDDLTRRSDVSLGEAIALAILGHGPFVMDHLDEEVAELICTLDAYSFYSFCDKGDPLSASLLEAARAITDRKEEREQKVTA